MTLEDLYNQYVVSSGVSTDSRTVSANQIFFALHGDNFDGNNYVGAAVSNGARLAVIDNPSVAGDKCFLVKDTLKELQSLATYHRKQISATVLAITGTNGKTTTKELVTAVLSKRYKVHATKGNLNNSIGVPLTILAAPSGTEIMIVEMGASHPGDINELCEVALPDMGLITNIGTAHIQGFGSNEGVVSTKTELYRFLEKRGSIRDLPTKLLNDNVLCGTVLYNDLDPLLSDQIKKVNTPATRLSSPVGKEVVISALPGKLTLDIQLKYKNDIHRVKTNLFGEYNLDNVRTAIGVGLYLGVDIEDIVEAIEGYVPANNRSQLMKSETNLLVCDAYNANPSSMRRAIEAFSQLDATNKVAIIGDMRELGDVSVSEHAAVVKLLEEKHFSSVILVGEEFAKVTSDSGFLSFPDIETVSVYLSGQPINNSTILLKGSRGVGLEKLFSKL